MAEDSNGDIPGLDHGYVFAHRYVGPKKALDVQIGRHFTKGTGWDTQDAQVYAGSWALIAPPAAPDIDENGQILGACETILAQFSDQIRSTGQRDVRWTKFGQDIKGGEAALINKFGSRLALRESNVMITCQGGAFLNFDRAKKQVALSGFPIKDGGKAAYITISTSKIGLVSPGGSGSISVSDNGITLNAKGASIAAAKVTLGIGANDPVVTLSYLAAVIGSIVAFVNTHIHPGVTAGVAATGPVATPLSITAQGSSSVFASK